MSNASRVCGAVFFSGVLLLDAGMTAAQVQTTTTTAGVVVSKTITTTTPANGTGLCTVPPLPEVAAPVTPSVDAGRQALGQKNYALAKAHFQPLAEKGDAAAEGALGQLLMQRCTGLEDKAGGLTWLQKAADDGDAPAALTLGTIYLNGTNDVAQDDSKAFALFSNAAAAGIMVAETDLGYMYLNGRGVPMDKYQGMVWSVKAGEQGAYGALSYIASAYEKGAGLPQNIDKALFYISCAMVRVPAQQRASLNGLLNDISRQSSVGNIRDDVADAKKWVPGPGSLSEVLADAAKWQKQQAKNVANKN